jgi:O-antigen ligase
MCWRPFSCAAETGLGWPRYKKGGLEMFGILIALLVARSAAELFAGVEIGPFHFNPPSLIGVLVIILAGVCFLRKRGADRPPLASIWAAWLILLLPSVFISLLAFGQPGLLAVREWIRLLSMAAVFFLADDLSRGDRARDGLRLLFLGLIIPMGVAVIQMIFQTGIVIYGQHRVMGSLSHPNALGQFLVLFIALTYARARSTSRPLWIILIAAEMVVLLATLNVSGFIMLAVLGAWIFLKEDRRGRALILGLAAFCALLIAADQNALMKTKMVESLTPNGIARSMKPVPEHAPARKKRDLPAPPLTVRQRYRNSLSFRFGNWSELARLSKEKPWLGHGLQSTGLLNPLKDEKGDGYSPHNDLIRYLFEGGLFGLLAYAGFVLLSWRQIWKAVRGPSGRRDSLTRWILAGLFLAWQVGSLGDNIISTTAFQFYFWAALGFILGRPGDAGEASPGSESNS